MPVWTQNCAAVWSAEHKILYVSQAPSMPGVLFELLSVFCFFFLQLAEEVVFEHSTSNKKKFSAISPCLGTKPGISTLLHAKKFTFSLLCGGWAQCLISKTIGAAFN